MSIDWFTVIAQWVNFLVLVFLLKKFLYGPIIRAMDAREARVRKRLEAAAKTKEDAERTAADYHRRRDEFQAERDGLLAKARKEAAASRAELEREARNDIEERRKRWRRALADQQESFLRELRRKLAAGVVDVSRRALAELADVALEAEVARAFEKRLDDVPEEEWRALATEAGEDGADLTVRSAFDLPEEARQRIVKRVAKVLPEAPAPQFETAKEVVCGIELRAGGRKMAWSVDEYLDRLADRVAGQLGEGAREAVAGNRAETAPAANDGPSSGPTGGTKPETVPARGEDRKPSADGEEAQQEPKASESP